MTIEQADELAWQAVCDWPAAAGFDPVIRGIDYSLLARYYLRHKVGRAVRTLRDPAEGRFEAVLQLRRRATSVSRVGKEKSPPLIKELLSPLLPGRRRRQADTPGARSPKNPEGGIFVAEIASRFEPCLEAFRATGRPLVVGEGVWKELDQIAARGHGWATRRWARRLCDQIESGLESYGIRLSAHDSQELRTELAASRITMGLVAAQLRTLAPGLLVTFADNHPPEMEYVLAARQASIPSLAIQHGLDCEIFALEDAFADYAAVWGQERLDRYQRHSAWQPTKMAIVGNPEFDQFRLPSSLSPTGRDWLWVTRPHVPEKCYLPSRSCREGLDILDALILAVRDTPGRCLAIKPHPADYRDLYEDRIDAAGLRHRITVSDEPLHRLLGAASVVIAEDSTAGAEAMFFGARMVHAHFAPSRPVMKFVEYGAAAPAFSSEQLGRALRRVENMSAGETERMLHGQRRFLLAHNGPCDGNSRKRLADFAQAILDGGVLERPSMSQPGLK